MPDDGQARDDEILIAGGGIGGLSVALALSRAGFAVHVLEQAEAFEEIGAGLQLGPNASRILQSWGLEDALIDKAGVPEEVLIFDGASGECLSALPLGAFAEMRYGAPYWVLHRADLQNALLEAVRAQDGVRLTTGFKLTRFETGDDEAKAHAGRSVTVHSESGETIRGGALIGADGLRSAVREQMRARARPVFSGKTAWRAVMPMSTVPYAMQHNAVGLWMSPGAHLVHYPVEAGKTVNVVAITSDISIPEGRDEPAQAPAQMLSAFANWPAPIRDFLAAQENWRRWPLYVMAPLRRWSEGRVTLLGDAAHPLVPFLASGAAMAIEDAAVLAYDMVHTAGDPVTAFVRYERKRAARTARVQSQSRKMGRIYHMGHVLRWVRNQVLTSRAPEELLARNDWLYSYRATPEV